MEELFPNFMLEDLSRGFLAFFIFPLFTVLPGYCLAAYFQILSFRNQNLYDRLAISTALSLGCFPVLFYLAGHFGSSLAMWLLAGLILAAAISVAIRQHDFNSVWKLGKPLLAAAGLALILILTLADLQLGHRLLASETELDYVKHVAVTSALFRAGADGVNPFFHPGHNVGLFYYQFWHLICSLVERVGSPFITARGAVLGGIAWPALGLVSVIRLYVKLFQPEAAIRTYRAAILLLLVSGLDIVPASLRNLRFLATGKGHFLFALEWWNVQVTSWLASICWVPQHIAGLVANLTGAFLLRSSFEHKDGRGIYMVLAGLCFATGIGLSVWVSLAFAVGIAVWILVCFLDKRRSEAMAFIIAGLIACLVAAPYLLHLRAVAQVHQSPIALTVRPFGPLLGLLSNQPRIVRAIVDLLALPLNYFLEFGFYAIAAFIWIRKIRRGEWRWSINDKLAAAFICASLFVITFSRSVMGTNDLGFRGALPAQFFLLLIGIRVLAGNQTGSSFHLSRTQPALSRLLLASIVLGVMTTAWDWGGTRIHYLVMPDMYQETPEYRYQARAAYEFLQEKISNDGITQHNPDRDLNVAFGLYGERQVVASDWFHGPLFSINPKTYGSTEQAIATVFRPGLSFEETMRVCSQYSIAALVVDSSDPAWADPRTWIWQVKPDLAQPSIRVFLVKNQTAQRSNEAKGSNFATSTRMTDTSPSQ